MKEALTWFFIRWRYAYLTVTVSLVSVTLALFYVTGSFAPGVRPYYFDSDREFLGMLLMMSILPAYLASCVIYAHRRTGDLAEELSDELLLRVSSVPTRWFTGFMLAGFAWAVIFNIPDYGLNFFSADTVGKTMIIAQIALWCIVAGLLSKIGRAHV